MIYDPIESRLLNPGLIYNLIQEKDVIMARNNNKYVKGAIRDLLYDYLERNFNWAADGDDLYLKNITYYQQVSQQRFRAVIMQLYREMELSRYYNPHVGNELYRMICDMHQRDFTYANAGDPLTERYYVPFRNGFYDPVSERFLPPSEGEDLIYTHVLPFEYDPKADCPFFKADIERFLPNEEDRKRVLSFCARALTPMRPTIAHFWVGDGNNYKSTLAEILLFMLGDLGAKINLKEIAGRRESRFQIANLKGKWLNVGEEIGKDAVSQGGIDKLKDMVTNTKLEGEIKGVQGRVSFYNMQKGIYPMNRTPLLNAFMDEAVFKRFRIIHFPEKIRPEEIDPNHAFKLVRDEGSGIFNYIMSFLKYYDEYNQQNPAETEKLWRFFCHSVFAFRDLCLVDVGTDQVYENGRFIQKNGMTLDELYQEYLQWCDENNRDVAEKREFSRLLSYTGIRVEYGFYLVEIRRGGPLDDPMDIDVNTILKEGSK